MPAPTLRPPRRRDSTGELSGGAKQCLAPSSLTLSDQGGDGTTVIVDGVDLPTAGFVTVNGDGGRLPRRR